MNRKFKPRSGQSPSDFVQELDSEALFAAFLEARKLDYLAEAAADYDSTPEATQFSERATAISAALEGKVMERH